MNFLVEKSCRFLINDLYYNNLWVYSTNKQGINPKDVMPKPLQNKLFKELTKLFFSVECLF